MDLDAPLNDEEFDTVMWALCQKSGIDPHSARGIAFSLMFRADFDLDFVTRFLAREHAKADPEGQALFSDISDNAFALALLRERGLRSQ